ncbi:MAG: MBOAT family protein [Desulfatitalea sp.]|nr:MBOAT family protein [Desulfatitalea sp.]NNJ99043.1 MBOAT family protein [Desulfatitalea sp.]
MLFPSTIFLLAFLPATILCYYTQRVLLGNRLRNTLLLLFSYMFYAYGADEFLLLLIASTAADYLLGRLIGRRRSANRLWVALSLVINLGLLGYFKYANFMLDQITPWLHILGFDPINDWSGMILPIGISFFTFQKISYIVDVYRGQTRAMANFVDFALYVAMFPQLVAGPIVRYKDIWDQINFRTESWHRFHMGALRFCWGLAKKVLIADACGQVADVVFGLDAAAVGTKAAWLGALTYTFQIYFDFSAYSDMAIGLARMFGFELRENFNRPYAAINITDFWRRWHISLSTWFRDYLYIPLGGNRKGAWRTGVHLMVVFGLCGLWHGASWTFIAWGFYHGVFLLAERILGLRSPSQKTLAPLRRAITFMIVLFGWVLFRSDTISEALLIFERMCLPVHVPLPYALADVLHARNLFFISVAVLATLGAAKLPTWEKIITTATPLRTAAVVATIALLLPYCTMMIMAGEINPFIYYKF